MFWPLAIAAGVYLIYVLTLFFSQRRLMFPGAPPAPPVSLSEADMERLWIEVPQASCEAWFLPPAGGGSPHPAIIFAHGNGERIEEWAEPFQCFTAAGFAVLLVEYPGYGRSTGTPSQKVITRVMTRAVDVLADRSEVDPSRIIGMGRSIGGGAVCRIPGDRLAALVLTSTFTSTRAFALPFIYPPFAVLDPYDNLAALRAYSGPVLIQHGLRDETVPVTHARALAASTKRSRLQLDNCGHNNSPPDWRAFCRQVLDFLREQGIHSD